MNGCELEKTVFADWSRVCETCSFQGDRPSYRHEIKLSSDNRTVIKNLRHRFFNDNGAFDFQCAKSLPGGLSFPKGLTVEHLVEETLRWYSLSEPLRRMSVTKLTKQRLRKAFNLFFIG